MGLQGGCGGGCGGGKGARQRKGVGLASALALTALIVILAFVCVGASFAHLTLTNRNERLTEAESCADSILQLASARLLQDPSFGSHGSAAQRSLEITLPQGSARLTFDPDTARNWGIPCSYQNMASEQSLPGYLRTLPPQSVQLLAEGRSGGNRRLVEAIINQPPFKWAVASTGRIHSRGGLKIMGVKDLSQLVNGIDNLPADQILPGHIVSDHASAEALRLDSTSGSPTLVTGDVQSVGSVALGPSTTVQGQVKANADPSDIPEMVVERYDPDGIDGLNQVATSIHHSTLQVSGLWRRQGNLTITSGGLEMEQGYLYVNGNLEIQGGITGKGAIFATGDVVVRGMSNFSTDNLQAIVARGNLVIEGSGPEQSSFQGLLFGGGNLSARNVSLVGTLLGTSREGEGSQIELDQVALVSNPAAISLDFPELFAPPTASANLFVVAEFGDHEREVQMIPAPYLTADRFYDPTHDRLDPDLVTGTALEPHWIDRQNGRLARSITDFQPQFARQGPDTMVQQMVRWNDPRELEEKMKEGVRMANEVYQRARARGLQPGQFSLDPNRFIQTSDKMRRLLWRVVE